MIGFGTTATLPSMAMATGPIPIQAPFTITRVFASSRAKTGKTKKKNAKMSTKVENADLERLEKVKNLERRADEVFEPSKDSNVFSVNAKESANERVDEVNGDAGLPFVDRSSILKACIGTSIGLSAVGFLARQASHLAAGSGLEIRDCTVLMPFNTELWHVIPALGAVAIVTSSRQILMQIWQDLAVSTELSNRQVLTQLGPVDCILVACLSGVSEELVFRGALLPFIGQDWSGILGAALIFGVLHRSGGRNSAFAIWASYVGVLYGILGVYTNDLATSILAHSASNFISAFIWKRNEDQGRDPL